MGLRPRNGISLCSGGGGLELGLQLAEPGFACRCFVEADADAQAVLVGNSEPELLDAIAARLAADRLPDGGAEIPVSPPDTRRRARPFHQAGLANICWGE